MKRRSLAVMVALLLLLPAVACRSPHVQVTVENRTGAEVRLLEVDYPSASFGVDSIAPGGDYHYKIQVTASGPVKVQYTDPANHQPQATGPALAEGDQGSLEIVLLQDGKAQFTPRLIHSR